MARSRRPINLLQRFSEQALRNMITVLQDDILVICQPVKMFEITQWRGVGSRLFEKKKGGRPDSSSYFAPVADFEAGLTKMCSIEHQPIERFRSFFRNSLDYAG